MNMVDALAGKLADCQEKLSITIRNNVSAAMEIADRDATIATLTAALVEARGALTIFALIDEQDIGREESDSDTFHPILSGYNMVRLATVGDFRRARTALATINAALGRKEP